jgi:hypothetical protein
MRLIIRFLLVILGILVAKAVLDTVVRAFSRRPGPRVTGRDPSRVEGDGSQPASPPFSKSDIVDVHYTEVEEKRP